MASESRVEENTTNAAEGTAVVCWPIQPAHPHFRGRVLREQSKCRIEIMQMEAAAAAVGPGLHKSRRHHQPPLPAGGAESAIEAWVVRTAGVYAYPEMLRLFDGH